MRISGVNDSIAADTNLFVRILILYISPNSLVIYLWILVEVSRVVAAMLMTITAISV